MANYELAIPKVLKNEGGYVNDPADLGGETYCGITRKYSPEWQGWPLIDIKKKFMDFPRTVYSDPLIKTAVNSYYKKAYWDKLLLDKMTSQKIAEELFDTGVNMGINYAGQFLQRTLNMVNTVKVIDDLFINLKVDGAVGEKTLSALDTALKSAPYMESVILKCLDILQGARYFEITEARQINEKFFRGWINARINIGG